MRYSNKGVNADKKAWLARYLEFKDEAENWYLTAVVLRNQMTGMTKPLSDMPRNPSPKRTDDTWIEHILLIEKCELNIKKAREALEEIENAIESIENNRQRRVLTLRYLHGNTWEQVAEKMKIDVRSVTRIHGAALDRIEIPEKEYEK